MKSLTSLTNLALIKALSIKNNVKQVVINKNRMSIIYYEDVDLTVLMNKVKGFKQFKFEKGNLPTISIDVDNYTIQTAINLFLEFLSV